MNRLSAITIPPSAPPPLGPRRAMELQAWCLFIDRWLDTGPEVPPLGAARRLLARLTTAGVATLSQGADLRAIHMLGVIARSRGSDHELLMCWRTAAMARLEGSA